jgi:protoporphyrinogen oxidase
MIGIVGDTLAGLVVARRLRDAGRDVRVFGADGPGPRVTHETDGETVEAFPDRLSRPDGPVAELAEALGVADRIEWRTGTHAHYVDGIVHPIDTFGQLLAYPHLSVRDKLRLLALRYGIDPRGGRPRRGAYEDAAAFDDDSIAAFLREHATDRVRAFFQPCLEAAFGERNAELSAAWLLANIESGGACDVFRQSRLGYPDGGRSALLDALGEAVGRERVATDSRVTGLSFREGTTTDGADAPIAATIESGEEAGTVETRDLEAVVVATGPTILESLTGYEADVEFGGSISALVSMERSLLDTHRLHVADEAPFDALVEHTNLVSPERYGGEHLLYATRSVRKSDGAAWTLDDEELAARWLEGLESLFPAFDPSTVTDVRVARDPERRPIYEPGCLEAVVPYDLGDDGLAGVYYAGSAARAHVFERPPDGSIAAGRAAADRLLDR